MIQSLKIVGRYDELAMEHERSSSEELVLDKPLARFSWAVGRVEG